MNERDPLDISAVLIKIQPGDRKLPRIVKRFPVSYMIIDGKDEGVWKEATSLDLSRLGMGFEAKENVEKASLLQIKVNTGEGPLTLKGEVMRSIQRAQDQYIVGVQFVDIPEDELGKLVRFVDLFQRLPLEQEITPEMAKYFTQNLFKNNRDIYIEVARNVSEAPTWEVAFRRIEEYWSKFGIDLYSEASIKFTDMVFERF